MRAAQPEIYKKIQLNPCFPRNFYIFSSELTNITS